MELKVENVDISFSGGLASAEEHLYRNQEIPHEPVM